MIIIKRLLFFVLSLLLTITGKVYALSYETCVDEWINDIAYCNGYRVYNEWSYDLIRKKYVLLDENGRKVRELDKMEEDPQAKRGKISIKAIVPKNLYDDNITVTVMSKLYLYKVVLNKDNNFSVNIEMIEDVYEIGYHSVSNHNNIPCPFQSTFRIIEGNTFELNLDYSKYDDGSEDKEDEKYKTIIVVGIIAFFVIIFVGIFILVNKAKNI